MLAQFYLLKSVINNVSYNNIEILAQFYLIISHNKVSYNTEMLEQLDIIKSVITL